MFPGDPCCLTQETPGKRGASSSSVLAGDLELQAELAEPVPFPFLGTTEMLTVLG